MQNVLAVRRALQQPPRVRNGWPFFPVVGPPRHITLQCTCPSPNPQGLVIFFIIAQGPKGEGMVNSMNESRMFNFSETRNFVTVATWGLIGGFLVFSALAALR